MSSIIQRNVNHKPLLSNGRLLAFAIAMALVTSVLLLPALVSADGSSSGCEIDAILSGAAINGVIPRGEAEFGCEPSGGNHFNVWVENVNLSAGTVFDVLVDGAKVGLLTLPGNLAHAELELKGQMNSQMNSRTRVVVATQSGITVVAGSFHMGPGPSPGMSPSPGMGPTPHMSPSPHMSPTPGANAAVWLEARLAGSAINGLTPVGMAKFRQQDDERKLDVEVERVNLPASAVLNVLIDSVKIGELKLTSMLEARLELETVKGQPVPNVATASTLNITDSQGRTILSGVFSAMQRHMGSMDRDHMGMDNDLDDHGFFVEQQYRDFLSREADDSGLSFWTNEIEQCGVDPGCVEVKRINTSAAFFLSIEFQETGYMLYRFNKASFGTMPRRNEFLVDMQSAGQGVIVGAPGWEQKLEDNKRRVADEWMEKPEFKQRFDPLSDDRFVDMLFANAGVQPTEAERNDLIKGMQEHRETRATVLRRVADNAELRRKEFNSAFVLMQYFGYLHRNPDEGPDTDMSGFNFWLKKLDDFGGDFQRAEMVRAFIESSEYRHRFEW